MMPSCIEFTTTEIESPMKILLLGAGGNAGMNFTKCLKMAGNLRNGWQSVYTIYGADPDRYNLSGSNCNHLANVHYPNTGNALDDEKYKIESILAICEEHQIHMIHAQPDREVEFLLRNYEQFKDRIFSHSLQAWEKYRDKYLCQKIWSESIVPFSIATYQQCYNNNMTFENMKNSGGGKVWVRARVGAGSKCALPISNFNQALFWVDYWKKEHQMTEDDFIFCEFLPGREYAVQVIFDHGRIVQAQARERLVYHFGAQMPSGQSSTPAVARLISDPLVYQRAYEAILAIETIPHGIYGVDIKTGKTGTLIPTEVNYGRFYTTSDFFATLSVNGPHTYCALTSIDIHSREVGAKIRQMPYPEIQVGELNKELYWIRGLDKQPRLVNFTSPGTDN